MLSQQSGKENSQPRTINFPKPQNNLELTAKTRLKETSSTEKKKEKLLCSAQRPTQNDLYISVEVQYSFK